ncbi:hypothetical protein OG21DRAFT_902527 [Imleria badia]|nr:hypothetical protein OG21DRAFT_902527 [Imleria badia]
MGKPAGVGGFVILPVFPAPGGPVPPVPYPAAFFPLGGPQPPDIPRMDRSPSAYSGMPDPDPSQHVGPTGPVFPAGTPYGEHPSRYVHCTEEPHERLIPLTPSSGSRSLPMFFPPLPGHDSRGLTPTQKSYHPPHSPGALPVPHGDVPNVIPVDPSISSPLPHQTMINIPQIGVPPPGHIVEPGIPVQSSPSGILPGVAVQPSLQGVPTRPIDIHSLMPGPVSELVYVPSRASYRTSTSDTTLPSERGVRDRRPSLSMEDAPGSSRHRSSYASVMGDDRRSPQRKPLCDAASVLPADLDDEQRNSSRALLAHEHPNDLDSSHLSKSASHQCSHTTTDRSGSSHGLASLEEEVFNAPTVVSTERPEAETTCANAAERRAIDYFHGLRVAVENRNRAEQESARVREELGLYKLQLENAQKEIFRAQDTINQVASQRNEAEAEAARARTKARKVQEEKLVMLAREEGRRMGYQEALSMGRQIGYYKEHHDGDENMPQPGRATSNEERNDPRSHVQLRSAPSTRQQPYVDDCVARSLSPTLITEYVPNRLYLSIHPKLPPMRRHFKFLLHRPLFVLDTHLLMRIVHPLRLVTSMNQNWEPFTRYRSAPQEPILAHLTSACHPHTNYGDPFPLPPVPSRVKSRMAEPPKNQSQSQSPLGASPPGRVHLEMSIAIRTVTIPVGRKQQASPNDGARTKTGPHPVCLRRRALMTKHGRL